MRAVPREGEDLLETNGHNGIDSMRSWLASGVQLVDRRRRFGGHGKTRKLLVVDPQARPATSEHWQSMTAALQRHTVSGALSELEPEHRRVIQLAYLEGHTNRQIAEVMGVSVTTVKRRLLKALERLELFIGAAGAWLAALVVAFGVYLGSRVAKLAGGPEDAQRVASAAAAATLAAAAVGVVTFMPDTVSHRHAPASANAPVVAGLTVPSSPDAGGPAIGTQEVQAPPDNTGSKGRAKDPAQPDLQEGGGSSATPGINGCHGNPTGAPAPVPVGPRSGHGLGPPVDPPGKGGCKNL